MVLIILITGRPNKKHDLLDLERVAMRPYGHTSMAWEGVFHALLIILTPGKFYDRLRSKEYVFVCPASANHSPAVTFSSLGSIDIHNPCPVHLRRAAGHCVPSM